MLIGKLEDISKVKEIPSQVLSFITCGEFLCGKHILSDTVYVNIEEYETKHLQDARFEAHKEYIDVQIVLEGKEELYYTDVNNLTVDIPYSKEKDIMFYKDKVAGNDKFTLDETNFIILFPQDAHAPQVCIDNNPAKVKKAVIKIKI